MVIRIKNLRLRTVIGVNDWERQQAQEVIVNVEMEYDGAPAAASDNLADTIDYHALKKRILAAVEKADCFLLERLATMVLDIVRQEAKVVRAVVEVDKPGALRFADSVSVSCSFQRRP